MIGKDSSPQSLGVVPCAISWLFRLIEERRERTGTRFSVRVSAAEVSGPDESLRDLLAEVASGSLQDAQSPGVYLREDPGCGVQVRHRLRGHGVGGQGHGSWGTVRTASGRQARVPACALPSPAAKPERASGAHGGEGRPVPGRGAGGPQLPPARLWLAPGLHAARLPVPRGEVRPRRE